MQNKCGSQRFFCKAAGNDFNGAVSTAKLNDSCHSCAVISAFGKFLKQKKRLASFALTKLRQP